MTAGNRLAKHGAPFAALLVGRPPESLRFEIDRGRFVADSVFREMKTGTAEAALAKFLAEGHSVQVCPPKAHGDPQRKPRKKALRQHPPVMKCTWFPDGQAYAATWENGQLAQFERDKWLASRAETDGAPRQPSRTVTRIDFESLPIELRMMVLFASLPIELRMLALGGLTANANAQGFALAAE